MGNTGASPDMGHKYYWKCWPWDSLSTLWNSHIVFYLIKNWHKDQCSEHVQPKQVEEEGLDDIEGSGTSSKDNNEDDEDIIDLFRLFLMPKTPVSNILLLQSHFFVFCHHLFLVFT